MEMKQAFQMTEQHRQIVRSALMSMPPEKRAEKLGQLRVQGAPGHLIAFAESVCVELAKAERQRADNPAPVVQEIHYEISPATWRTVRKSALGLSVLGGVVATGAYVVLPALVAAGEAAATFAAACAPWGIGILGGLALLRMMFAGRDKEPGPGGEKQYIINQTVNINQQ
jgi:hypothetical protein